MMQTELGAALRLYVPRVGTFGVVQLGVRDGGSVQTGYLPGVHLQKVDESVILKVTPVAGEREREGRWASECVSDRERGESMLPS